VPTPDPADDVLAALENLEAVLRENMERNRTAIRRADEIRRLRDRGHRYSEIVPIEERPLIVELLTRNLNELSDASSRFRRVEARALYEEGLTMAEIADLFGVTRQRVAALLERSKLDEGTDAARGDGKLRTVIPLGITQALDGGAAFVNRLFDSNPPV
jgi:DNA-directed RNA polymerase specialized sigma24 family protein